MRKWVFLSLVVLSFILFLSGCGGGVVNQPPTILGITIDPEPGVVNQPVQIAVNAVDVNGDELVYHVAVIPPGAVPGALGGVAVSDLGTNTTGQFTYTPTVEGTHTVVASVTDKKEEVRKEKDFQVVQPSSGKIEIIEPANGAKFEEGQKVSVDSSKTSDITSLRYKVFKNSTKVEDSGCLTDTSWSFTPSSTGSYKICVEGYEGCCCAGDVLATDCVLIDVVENSSPSATLSSVDSTECCNYIDITWKATDDWGLDIGTLTIYWKDYGGVDASDTVVIAFGGVKEATGSYGPFHPYTDSVSVEFKVKDIFGRTKNVSKYISITDTTAPKLTVTADAKSAWTTTSTEVSWCFSYAVTRELKMTDCCTDNILHYEAEYPNGYVEETIDPQDGQPGWSRSDDLDEEGTYDATVVATDTCSSEKSTLVAHITIDWTAPEVDLDVPDSTICKTGKDSTFTATDLHMKEWVVKVETTNNSTNAASGTNNRENTTFTLNAFDEDYTQATVTVVATDECGNFSKIVKTVYMDGKFGAIDLEVHDSDVNTGAVNIDGVATDNCTVKEATVFIYQGGSDADLDATITGEGSKVVTMQGTVTPHDGVEATVCVEFAATDNCCEYDAVATGCMYFDTKAPSYTDGGAFLYINQNPGSDRKDHAVIKFHEKIVWSTIATLTYTDGTNTFQAVSSDFSYYNGVETQLRVDFATDLPDNIKKATITVYKVCDEYDNCVPVDEEIPIPEDHVFLITTAPGR